MFNFQATSPHVIFFFNAFIAYTYVKYNATFILKAHLWQHRASQSTRIKIQQK